MSNISRCDCELRADGTVLPEAPPGVVSGATQERNRDVTEPVSADERRAAMLARRAEISAAHPEITQASELAPLMGDLEREYWDWQIGRYLAAELGETSE